MFVFPAPVSATRRVASARLLDHLFAERTEAPATTSRVPAMDVTENDTTFTLTFDVPGASREQLKVSVQGRRVVLETADAEAAPAAAPDAPAAEAATPATAAAAPADRVLYRERAAARYARTVVLPAEVDAGRAAARFDNGVLTLTVSKKQPTGATQIAIG